MHTINASGYAARPIIRALCLVGMLCLVHGIAANAIAAQPSISAQAGLGAYERVEGWVRSWDLPSAELPEAASEPLCAAVVTLRLDGRVFGRGSAASPDPDPTLLWRATSRAINSANSKLSNERDAMWEASIKQIVSRIMITLELGDTLTPISPSELDLPGFGYSPGSMGFAARLGHETDAIGPESMLVRRGDPAQTTAALALTLSNDSGLVMRSLGELVEQGFVFYRWVPMALAQPAPGLGAAFVDRGGRVIGADEITMRSIDGMGDNIAQHLMSRRWAGVEDYGFMGTLDPVTGKVDAPSAPPFEQALGAYALLRYGRDASNELEREAVIAGREVLRALGRVEPRELEPWGDPVSSSMVVVALSEMPLEMILGDEALGTLRTRCLETLDGAYSMDGGFDGSLPTAARGLIVQALVCSAKLDPRDRTELARSAIARVWLETDPSMIVGQMPFLAWAEIERADQSGEIPSRTALRQMRELVWDHQLRRDDLGWVDRDLAGGIVFTSAKAPLPSWAGLRPLAGIATMLGDERLTPGGITSGEVPAEITRLVDSIRFVRQLMGEGEIMHLYSDVASARYGVRMALWDQRMPVEADAMALLMLRETQASFGRLIGR